MAPSQDLRYEWSDRYRFRMNHFEAASLLTVAPSLLGCAMLIPLILMWITTVPTKTILAVGSIVGGFFLSALVARGQGRTIERERMRFASFLREADARGGWWFLRDSTGSAHIVGRGATDHGDWPPQLVELLDPAKEAHRMAMRDELARLRGIAVECDRTSLASREAAGELESLLAFGSTRQPA